VVSRTTPAIPLLPCARAELDAAVADHAFDLHGVAFARVGDARQPRLVLIAQRQVQREIDVAQEAELFHRALRRRFRLGRRGGGRGDVADGGGLGHGTILPAPSSGR